MLHPSNFLGNETPLEAEQWLIKMEQLLNAAKNLEEDQVDVVSIQLTDIVYIWWTAKMERLTPPICWKTFSESFLVKFFPMTTKRRWRGNSSTWIKGNILWISMPHNLPDSVALRHIWWHKEGTMQGGFFKGWISTFRAILLYFCSIPTPKFWRW